MVGGEDTQEQGTNRAKRERERDSNKAGHDECTANKSLSVILFLVT